MNTAPISLRLPEKVNSILETLATELHITKTQLIKEAILERIEDYLDSKTIDRILAKNEPTITQEEMERQLGL